MTLRLRIGVAALTIAAAASFAQIATAAPAPNKHASGPVAHAHGATSAFGSLVNRPKLR